MSVRFTILGSGSRGNCAYLETDQVRLLIDAGFSGKQIRERLASIGRTPETLDGILLTHEHSDHTQGLRILSSRLKLPIYCNRLTKEAVENQLGASVKGKLFTTGDSFELGDVEIDTFSVPHDAYDPVGFVLRTEAGTIGFLTDLGHATKMIIHRVQCANILVLEANHDMKLLQEDTKRPWSTKQRIMSRHGHLSNEAAARVLDEIVTEKLQRVYLGHLSSDCNTPELAKETVSQQLSANNVDHVHLENTAQSAPCSTLDVASVSTS